MITYLNVVSIGLWVETNFGVHFLVGDWVACVAMALVVSMISTGWIMRIFVGDVGVTIVIGSIWNIHNKLDKKF